MAFDMIVQLPVSMAFGTDEEFDLRVRLEQDLSAALAEAGAGTCGGGEIDTSHLKLYLDSIPDALPALDVVKAVLARSGLLARAMIVLETCCGSDPDDRDWRVLWPPNYSGAFRFA
jgi:hypothetical protein